MINRVEMTNWRAYKRKVIDFQPGVTFIMGPNGKGKTSLLEAVAYALTGQPATVKDRGKLLRDPQKPAVVRLTFTVDKQQYIVERTQLISRAAGASLIEARSGKKLAGTHRAVTERIEKIMGVSSDFLQRIVYMSEGNVFRFLRDNSGKALSEQVRRVLGLTQMDELLIALKKAQKQIKEQISTIRSIQQELETLHVTRAADLEYQFSQIEQARDDLQVQLRKLDIERTEYLREQNDMARLKRWLDNAVSALRDASANWADIERIPVLTLYEQLVARTEATRETVTRIKQHQARLEGEAQAYQRILDILLPYAGKKSTLPCPVCRKPMTETERTQIIRDIQKDIDKIDREFTRKLQELNQAEAEYRHLAQQSAALQELRNNLAHVTFSSISSHASLAELLRITQQPLSTPVTKSEGQKQIQEQIQQLNKTYARYLTLQNRLEQEGYKTPEELRQALLNLEIRSLSLRAAEQAVHKTLSIQRNVDMNQIYKQIALVWSAFHGKQHWQMELDGKGMPTFKNEAGQQFDLSQFSGGEKTAILVILHTIIANYFSQSDFLLIDEPLEHLDPVNRRSLIRFLVGAYRKNRFQQAIIATFEESLIRKYMSDEGVNIIHI